MAPLLIASLCRTAFGHAFIAWANYSLAVCGDTVVFRTWLNNNLDDINAPPPTFRACSISNSPVDHDPAASISAFSQVRAAASSSVDTLRGCKSGAKVRKEEVSLQVLINNGQANGGDGGPSNIADASAGLSAVLAQELDCETTSLFAKSGSTIMGMYIGAAVEKNSAMQLLEHFTPHLQSGTSASQVSVQLCGDRRPSRLATGIFVDYTGNVSAVHDAVRRWSRAECVTDFEEEQSMDGIEIGFLPIRSIPLIGAKIGAPADNAESNFVMSLSPRADCEPVQVDTGDGCWSLAEACGISEDDFKKYNPVKDLCDNPVIIQEGQYYCCNEGTLPDFSPQPDADGNCVTHTVLDKQVCFDIANSYNTSPKKLEEVNGQTWAWGGCSALQEGQVICVGEGNPPMPAPVDNAECGPQVPGSEMPEDGKLVDMNPCPLRACCNVWGRCGTTADYCIPSPADTGAPGAAKPNSNGCISNCGMEIVNNEEGPKEFISLAYFEAWNLDRPCAHLDVTEIPAHHTHIHFASVDLTPDFRIDTSRVQYQFDRFLGLDTGVKRIISFGGWAFSTEQETYKIFRQGVLPGNAEVLAANVAEFVVSNGLDGVDFDWEYPGAPDINVDDPDDPENGNHYLDFLKLVKGLLPGGKSISIAAPASFWYLKAYPIEEMAKILDYIVYMTYDLHGQWDYDIWWSSPGCSTREEGLGNCLRSHVNWTETENALSMVTKAGVPSNKILVGISSYGRSFKMAEAGCTGPMCRFLGTRNESAALPGECTETGGYISEFEIRQIISMYENADTAADDEYGVGAAPEGSYKRWYDEESESDILVYQSTEWVAWMDDDTKTARIERYKKLNFAGVSDWAVDLAGGRDYQDPPTSEEVVDDMCPEKSFKDLQDLEENGGDLAASCAAEKTMDILGKMLDDAVKKYSDLDNESYDKRFNFYIDAVREVSKANLAECMSWNNNGPCNAHFKCTFKDGSGEQKGDCPLKKYDPTGDASFVITYDLEDKDGLYETLEAEFGVSREWVEFKDLVQEDKCVGTAPPPGSNPRPVAEEPLLERRQCVRFRREFKNYPTIKSDAKVPNPKDAIKSSLENVESMRRELAIASLEVGLGLWEGDDGELAEAASLPVLVLVQSVDSMEQVHEVGGEIEEREAEAKKRNLILTVIMAVLIVIPIAGEAALALGWTTVTIARFAVMVGLAGDVALSVVDMVDDPSSVFMSALLLLIPGLPGSIKRSPSAVKDLLRKKKGFGDDLYRVGEVFKKHDSSIQNIVGKVCRR